MYVFGKENDQKPLAIKERLLEFRLFIDLLLDLLELLSFYASHKRPTGTYKAHKELNKKQYTKHHKQR